MKAVLLLIAFLGPGVSMATSTDDFVTTWKTDNPGISNDTSITVPMIGGPYDVDWNNDGTFDEFGLADLATHDYGDAGTYTIRITGTFDSIRFEDSGDKEKIISIDQWGTQSWTSMARAFEGAANLQVLATDIPDLSRVLSMRGMFMYAYQADPFTSGWDTSAVVDMSMMFRMAISANPDTSGWNTSAVTDMSWMFNNATSAKPDTSSWDTSAVTWMQGMFSDATSADPDTADWDTSAVTMMQQMFERATSANPNISAWDTGAVKIMTAMFLGATSFDQDIGSWDVSSLLEASSMFSGTSLSMANYDSLLIGWNAQELQPEVTFSGGNSKFCSVAAVAARANLFASNSWKITDGGQCSEIIFQDSLEDVPLECPCWDEIELTSVTAENHYDTFSCDTAYPEEHDVLIQNIEPDYPIAEGGFWAEDYSARGGQIRCATRDFEPFEQQITAEEVSLCISQIVARCAEIGHPILVPD